MRRTLFEDYQELVADDLTRAGIFAQEAIDAAVADGIAAGNYYVGCLVSQTGPTAVQMAPGRVYMGGKAYFTATPLSFSLSADLPAATKRIITICAYGSEIDTEIEPRDYVTNQTTGEAEGRNAPRERRRTLNTQVVKGAEAPNPVRGEVGTSLVPICDIVLSTTGIAEIVMVEETELKSAEENRQSIELLENFRDTAGKRIDTLASDITNLAERTKGILSPSIVRRLLMDVSRLKQQAKLPDTYQSYSYDPFPNTAGSSPLHANWLARIEEGIRFPAAQEQIAILRPFNVNEPKLKKTGDFALPAYTDDVRISVTGKDTELSISQHQYQTVTMVKREVSHSAVRYGSSYTTCTNRAEFYNGTYNDTAQTLQRDGQTFAVEFTGVDYGAPLGLQGHQEVRLTEMWTDSWTESYWDAVTTTEGLNGAIVGQSFLNANGGWMVAVNLYLSRVGATGDVKVLVTELNSNGAPAINRTIAKGVIAAADLKQHPLPSRCNFTPCHLEAGNRYAIVLVTDGQHFVSLVTNNKYAQGTLFHSSDGAWFQGDIEKDMAFEAIFAKFAGARVEVDFQPLTLENGMANIKLLTVGHVPKGTKLMWEYQKSSDNIWHTIDPDVGVNGTNPLNGLPALVKLRAVFLGTTDDMPGIDVAKSESRTWRPRTDFTWISKLFDLGSGNTTTSVTVEVRVEAYNETPHDITVTLLRGGGETVETPDITVTEPDPYDPKAFIKRYTFNLAAAAQTYKLKIVGATTSATQTYHVASVFQAAA